MAYSIRLFIGNPLLTRPNLHGYTTPQCEVVPSMWFFPPGTIDSLTGFYLKPREWPQTDPRGTPSLESLILYLFQHHYGIFKRSQHHRVPISKTYRSLSIFVFQLVVEGLLS